MSPARDRELPLDLGGIHAEPGARRPVDAPVLEQIVQDRLQQVDRNHHVALHLLAAPLLLHEQRADAEQPPFGADERGAAPIRMRRRREDRLVEHVLPVAGELALAEHARLERMRSPAVPGDHHLVADLAGGGGAALERRQLEAPERLHQPEAARLVVGERETRDGGAVVGRQPYRVRLGDQVADGEHEPVADHDAVAGALGAEDLRGESVLRHLGAQQHHRVERSLEVEACVVRLRTHLFREGPLFRFGHRAMLHAAPHAAQAVAARIAARRQGWTSRA
jgi:hypothetical protein